MKTEVKEIPFNDGSLLGVRTPDGKVWLAVRKSCLDIGLSLGQTQKQITNIQSDVVLEIQLLLFSNGSNGRQQRSQKRAVILE